MTPFKTLLAATTAVALAAAPASAQDTATAKFPRLRMGLDAVSIWQTLEQRNDSGTLPNLTSGWQAALGNMHLYVDLADSVNVYAELYLSSKHHPGQVMDREGWVRIGRLPEGWDFLHLNGLFKYIDIKAGHFEVDFGNQHLTRSDNAQVQRNPLIGNYVVDPNTVQAGLEIIGGVGAFHAVVGVGSGVTVEDFQPGRGYSLNGKVWIEPADKRFNVAASVYQIDHSGNPNQFPAGGSNTELFSGNRSGSRYSGVISLKSADAGQLLLGRGEDVLAWQLDAMVNVGPVQVSGLYGRFEDSDINGSDPGTPKEKATYYGAEAKWDLLFDMAHLAARFSGASISSFRGAATDASVARYQVGLSFRLLSQVLAKVEYVHQRYDGFPTAYTANPRFNGVLVETSMSF